MFHNQKGLTLIEIILAIAILGIIIVAILNTFGFAYSNVHSAGDRTENSYELRTICSDLEVRNNTDKYINSSEISSYLTSRGYFEVAALSDIKVQVGSNVVNYFIDPITRDTVEGFDITFCKFNNNGKQSVTITMFLIKGGAI